MRKIHACCITFVFIFSSLAGCTTEPTDDSEDTGEYQEELNQLELENQLLAQTILELEHMIDEHKATIQQLNSDLNSSKE